MVPRGWGWVPSSGEGELPQLCTGIHWEFSQLSLFPGLPFYPQYEVTQKQCTGCPGMVTFYIKGNIKNASAFLKSLKVK